MNLVPSDAITEEKANRHQTEQDKTPKINSNITFIHGLPSTDSSNESSSQEDNGEEGHLGSDFDHLNFSTNNNDNYNFSGTSSFLTTLPFLFSLSKPPLSTTISLSLPCSILFLFRFL